MQARSRISPLRRIHSTALPLLAVLLASCGGNIEPPPQTTARPAHLPTFLDDPAEPVNRGIWAVNRAILETLVHPTSRAYRAIIPARARDSIGNAGTNILYPGRLINEVLQGRWQDAGDDTLRFLTNSTVGLAGLFDVASHWDVPQPQADFAETFQKWGWKPQTYVMLPILGPSDQSSAVASVFQEAADPLNYIPDLRAANLTFSGHRLTERTDDVMRLISSEADAYSFTHIAWSYFGRRDSPDWTTHGPPDMSTLETLGAAIIHLDDKDFPYKLKNGKVRIPATGKQLPYSLRMQPGAAPLAYVLPGLGSHRLSSTALALAEHLHINGFSVCIVSSAFHPEFMESASTSPLPGRIHQDAHDLWNSLSSIDSQLTRRFPNRITHRAMVGASMGGYLTLSLAASPPPNTQLHIDRFLAINPPIDLMHGVKVVDSFISAPSAWPEPLRQARIDNAIHKVGAIATRPTSQLKGPPFDSTESKLLIGLNFRFALRDVIHSVEKRHNLGIITTPFSYFSRRAAYGEMLGLTYHRYAQEVMVPYYLARGTKSAEFRRNRSLVTRSGPLLKNRHAMVITNRNDFLLRPQDISWLRSTFPAGRLTLLPSGGHLGNLGSPEVRSHIHRMLKDLH